MGIWHWIITKEDYGKLVERWHEEVRDKYQEAFAPYYKYAIVGQEDPEDFFENDELEELEEYYIFENWLINNYGFKISEVAQMKEMLDYLEERNFGLFITFYTFSAMIKA